MILEAKKLVRTPIENLFLNEMVEEDTSFIVAAEDAVDEIVDSDSGKLFDSSSSEDELEDMNADDLLDDMDLF